MAEFIDMEEQIDKFQIQELESRLNFKFPEDYTKHLLEYNGGRCIPNVFAFMENGNLTKSSVDWFLALHDGEYDSLENEFKVLKIEEKRMPDTFFPFANDALGNCLCMNGADSKIYFWDHEKEVDYSESDDNDTSNLYFVAENLNEFISNLTEA
ncbi:SMI1/KNR4 family protein [Maribacter sp. 2-571]|uniref:SMI1/KNR4 family protein n=1 Tax=Maribacter sp. 2-571 TaxID=3417569 RepID=UPI003D333E18